MGSQKNPYKKSTWTGSSSSSSGGGGSSSTTDNTIVSGGLTTAEKLASKNPAVRAEGEAEAANRVVSGGLTSGEKLASSNPAVRAEGQAEIEQYINQAKGISGYEGTTTKETIDKDTRTIEVRRTTPSRLRTNERGQIVLKTAGDWIRYQRATGMTNKELNQELRMVYPETAGDIVMLSRRKKLDTPTFTALNKTFAGETLTAGDVVRVARVTGKSSDVKDLSQYSIDLKKVEDQKETFFGKAKTKAKEIKTKAVGYVPEGVKETTKETGALLKWAFYDMPVKSFYKFGEERGVTPESIGKETTSLIKKVPVSTTTARREAVTIQYKDGKVTSTTLDVKKYEENVKKAKESRVKQAEISGGFVTGATAYPRDKPIQTVVILAAPYTLRGVGAGVKVLGGKSTIVTSDAIRLAAGEKVAAYATKGLVLSGKVAATSVKVGAGTYYAYGKVQDYKAAPTYTEKGKVLGQTAFETGAFVTGALATQNIPSPFEKSAEFVRGRLAIRSNIDYATGRNIKIVDDSAKLSQELIKVKVGDPRGNYPFEDVKSITPKQVKFSQQYFSKGDSILQGSGTQGAYYERGTPLYKEYIKTKGKIGDIDYFYTGSQPPKQLSSVADTHTYSERFIFRRSPFTKTEVTTPRGEFLTSYQEQSGKLFSGLTTERASPTTGKQAFYRAEEDITKLLFQYKFAQQEGLTTSKATTAYKSLISTPKGTGQYDIKINVGGFKQPNLVADTTYIPSPSPTTFTFNSAFANQPKASLSPSTRGLSFSPSSFSYSFSPSRSFSPSVSPSSSFSPSPSPSPSFSPSSSFSPSPSPSPSPSFSPSPSLSPSPSVSPSPSPSLSPSISPSFSPSIPPPTCC